MIIFSLIRRCQNFSPGKNFYIYGTFSCYQGHRQEFHGGFSKEVCALRVQVKKILSHAHFDHTFHYCTLATIYRQVFEENDRKTMQILLFYGS